MTPALLLTAFTALAVSAPGPWWEAIDDPQLAPVLNEALANNGDLEAVRLRADAAHLGAQALWAPMLPTLSLDASGNLAPLDSLGFQFGGLTGGAPTGGAAVPLPMQLAQAAKEKPPEVYYSGQAALSARLKIDLGRSFMSQQAQASEADASEDDRDARALAIAQQVARAYYDLVFARQQVKLIEQQIATNQQVLDVIELRFQSGSDASALDVLQQRQNLAAIETMLPSARANVNVLGQQLASLMGREDGSPPTVAETFPAIPPLVDAADADAIGGRPDIRAARTRLDAASTRERAAMLSFLPTFGLTAQAGQQAIVFDIEDPSTQPFWGAGASVSIPLFVGGQRWAQWQQAGRATSASRAQLRQLELRAAQVANAAALREDGLREQLEASKKQLTAAEVALDKSKERYLHGIAPYQAVQVALNSTLGSRLTVLSTHRQLVDARLQRLDAEGGQWMHDVGRRRPR